MQAEAWTARRLDSGDDKAGAKLGVSSTIDVHFDYSLLKARFDNFSVTATGPGEGNIEFIPAADDAATINDATKLGMYFFVRVWPCKTPCTPQATALGSKENAYPQFSASSFDGQQDQYAGPKFRVAWSQPGTYYVGLNGAWSGETCHNVVQSPVDGVHTAAYPQVDGVFQPVAIVVPFENGTTIPTPPGFAGPTFTLPAIKGDKRVALSKRNMTFFNGAHFYIPTMMPITGGLSQCGEGCVATAPAAVDLELPHGVTLDNASGVAQALPPGLKAATHHRVRCLCSVAHCAMSMPTGLLVADSIVGQTLDVGFRALDAAHLKADADDDSWFVASVKMAPRPDVKLPKAMSTGLTYGLSLSSWPSDPATGVTPLDTYRRLGLNTVSDHSWADPANRTGWAALGLKYGPEAGCPFSIPTPTVAAATAVNMSALCPGLSPTEEADEHTKYVNAAKFYATASVDDPSTSSGNDIGYNGCINKAAIAKFQAGVLASQPDVQFYDWEGWTDMEHWVRNVQASANAQAQKLPGESQADLAYRMAANWFDLMINATKAACPKTDTAMFGGYAADNKGCCSGSKLGIFSWEMLKARGAYSNPGWYSGQKNLRLLAAQVGHWDYRVFDP